MEMSFPGFQKKALTLSYDDGMDCDIRLIETMEKYGLRGTFNINTEMFASKPDEWIPGRKFRRLCEDEAYALYRAHKMEAAVHTCRHLHLPGLSKNECLYEILRDRTNIERGMGCLCRGMAYPYGAYTDETVEVLRECGILYARTCNATYSFEIAKDWLRLPVTCHQGDPQLMPLAQQFAELTVKPEGACKLFYVWGHSYEFAGEYSWDLIENFGAAIGNRPDIWYATNEEIFSYIEAFRALRKSNDGQLVYNPTAFTLYLNDCGRNYTVAPGETVSLAK